MASNKPDDSIRVYSILGKPEGKIIKMGDICVTKKFHKNYLSDYNGWSLLNRGHPGQFDKALSDDLIEKAKQRAKELNADAIVDLSVDQEHHAWTCYGTAVRVLKESSSKERNNNVREGKDDAPPAKKKAKASDIFRTTPEEAPPGEKAKFNPFHAFKALKPREEVPPPSRKEEAAKKESRSEELNNVKKEKYEDASPSRKMMHAPKKLSPVLADIVGKRVASRAELMKLVWSYIKEKQLQDPDDKQYFTPDKKMSKVFGADKIRAFGMAKYIGPHISDI